MSDLTGRTLGKYDLVERLGRGGMADVYKAIQRGMERFVAVKVMHGHLAESEDFIVRFKREAQSVGNLRHPHIVQVIDFDVEGDVYYMVMEYIKGGTLKTYIQQKGALPVDEALRVTGQLSDALAYAHEHGMIHRDIKPANVMFTDNSFTHPVLTDFGIARILGQSGITMSGAFIGTPAYMSPEAGRGTKVDERSDIYSMGIMLYEMVTGTVPYDADTPFAIVMKHINDPLPSPRRFNHDLPNAVEVVVLKALSKDPEDRYQTAGDLRKAVQQAREDAKTEAPTADSHKLSTAVGGKSPTEMPTYIPDTPSGKELPTISPQKTPPVPDTFAKEKTQPPVVAAKPKIPYVLIGGAALIVAIIAIAAVLILGGGEDGGDEKDVNVPTNTTEVEIELPPAPTTESTEVVTEIATEAPTQPAAASEAATEDGPQPTVFAGVMTTEAPPPPTVSVVQTQVAVAPASTVDLSEPSDTGGNPDPAPSSTEPVMAPPVNGDSEGRYAKFVPDDDPAVIDLANTIDTVDDDQGVDAALALTETGLQTYPGNPILLALHSGYLLSLDRPEEALADAEQAVADFPEHPVGYLALANYYYSSDDYDYEVAFQNIERAFNLAPDNRTTTFSYALALLGQSRLDEAVEQFNRAEDLGHPIIEVLSRRTDAYWQMGDYTAASVDLERLLVIQESADIRFYLVGTYLLTDRPDDAMQVIEAGFAFYDAEPRYYANAAYVAHTAGNGEQAEEWANTALALDGNMTIARYVLGLITFSRGDFEVAETRFQEVADAENQDYEYPYLNPTYDRLLALDQARAARELGKVEQAIEFYQMAIEDTGWWWHTPYLEQATLYVEQGDWDAAAIDFREAYRITQDRDSQDEVVNALKTQPIEVIRTVIRQWIDDDGNYDLGHDFAGEVEPQFPDDQFLLFYMAEVHVLREEYDAALEEGQYLVETAPDSPLGYLVLAYYYRQTESDSDEQMLAYAQQALDRAPEDPIITLEYARILNDADLGEAVIEAYYDAEDVGADLATVLDERSSYAAQTGDFDQAIDDLLALMEIWTDDPYLVTRLASYYLHDDDLEAALDLAIQYQAIEMSEDTTSNYYPDLAFLAWLDEDDELARSFLNRVHVGYREVPKVILMNGLLLQLDGEYEESNALLESLLETAEWEYDYPFFNPDFDHSLNLEIARNYVELEEPDAAIGAYRRAIERYYGWLTPRLELADVLIEAGDIEGARTELLIALDLAEEEAIRETIRQKIVELGPAPAN